MLNLVLNSINNTYYSIINDPWKDEVLALWVPIASYWIYSLLFHFLMMAKIPYFEQYRIHSPTDNDKRNRVSVQRVLIMVTLQQIIQIFLGVLVLHPIHPDVKALQQEQSLTRIFSYTLFFVNKVFSSTKDQNVQLALNLADIIYWAIIPSIQFFIAMVILDAHQYFLHRLFHMNKFLYKNFHSHHHRLYVPYAFGALYNHPVEGFLLDSLGAAIAVEITLMSPRMSMFFFTFATLKTVDDHCGYLIPWDPLQFLFNNNVKYHDIHHQPYGIKSNFSQPFFTFWDKLLKTEMPVKTREKVSGSDKLN